MVTRMSEEQGGVGKQRIDPVTQYFKLVRSTSKNPPKLTRLVPKMPVPSLETVSYTHLTLPTTPYV